MENSLDTNFEAHEKLCLHTLETPIYLRSLDFRIYFACSTLQIFKSNLLLFLSSLLHILVTCFAYKIFYLNWIVFV